MVVFEIVTGHITLRCSGENGVIKRKSGQKVKIPPDSAILKLSNQAIKTEKPEDIKKLREFGEKIPKVMEGDTIITGKDTSIILSSSSNKGKDRPIEGWQAGVSKIITLFPNSEIKISGIEKWDRTDEKAKKRWHGEIFKNVEMIKGTINCIYSRTEDPLLTPVASIQFIGEGGSGNFDFYQDNLYCWPVAGGKGGIIFTNRLTKKKFQPKLKMPEEIIVTRNAIFRKPMTRMDEFPMLKSISGTINIMADSLKFDPDVLKKQKNQMKNLGKVADSGMAGMDMLQGMTPEDLERVIKLSGQKIDPEQLKKIKEMPAMLKEMEKSGKIAEMKKGFAMMKSMTKGLGDEGIETMIDFQAEGMKKAEEEFAKLKKDINSAESKPKNYGPLTAEFKVA